MAAPLAVPVLPVVMVSAPRRTCSRASLIEGPSKSSDPRDFMSSSQVRRRLTNSLGSMCLALDDQFRHNQCLLAVIGRESAGIPGATCPASPKDDPVSAPRAPFSVLAIVAQASGVVAISPSICLQIDCEIIHQDHCRSLEHCRRDRWSRHGWQRRGESERVPPYEEEDKNNAGKLGSST